MRTTKKNAATVAVILACLASYAGWDVAAFVWPAYQPEPRWAELGIFGHGTGEWQNVYEAKPKYEGHVQPKVPLWGYENEADPIVVARKIDAALAAGVNVFIYDWYWYGGRPFLENGLNEGFLKAPNNERMKFFIMWANHDVDYLWNNKKAVKNVEPPLFNARVSYDEFTKVLVPRFINYFKKSNYYKIAGKPVFSIYRLSTFIEGVGGAQKAKEALKYLDKACVDAGFAGSHVMVIGALPQKIDGVPELAGKGKKEISKYLGIDSSSTYSWNYGTWERIHENPPLQYKELMEMSFSVWDRLKVENGCPFYPNVSVGWDTNPRYPADVLDPMVMGANPKDFEFALRKAKDWVEKNTDGNPKLILINSWNEWTEGGYLEPDAQWGYAYLNAVARVFGASAQSSEK